MAGCSDLCFTKEERTHLSPPLTHPLTPPSPLHCVFFFLVFFSPAAPLYATICARMIQFIAADAAYAPTTDAEPPPAPS